MHRISGAYKDPPWPPHDPPPQPAQSRPGWPVIEWIELIVIVIRERPVEVGSPTPAVAPASDVERWTRAGSLPPEVMRLVIHGAALLSPWEDGRGCLVCACDPVYRDAASVGCTVRLITYVCTSRCTYPSDK